MIEEQKQDNLVNQGLQKIRFGAQPVPGEINASVAGWMVENLSHKGAAE